MHEDSTAEARYRATTRAGSAKGRRLSEVEDRIEVGRWWSGLQDSQRFEVVAVLSVDDIGSDRVAGPENSYGRDSRMEEASGTGNRQQRKALDKRERRG